jgi:hypothetical protein
MYRTCERYLNGAIDRATFVVQAGRDWRAMIAILAIEQLTRTVRPPSTIISAGSTSARVEDAVDIARQLAIAQDAEAVAQRQLTTAQASDPQCSPVTDDNRAACAQKDVRVAAAQANFDRAKNNREVWERVMASPPPAAMSSASTGRGPDDPGGGTTQPIGPSDRVALVIGEIVERAFDTDETQLFCLQVLTPESGLRVDESLKSRCTDYLLAVVEAQGARLLQRSDLRFRGFGEAMEVRTVRTQFLDYLRQLPPAQYAAEAEAIRAIVPGFCTRAANLQQCIQLIEGGGLDNVEADLIRRALEARTNAQQGGQW